VELFDRTFGQISARELHDILRLRVDVFVVEQGCAYSELDGRDIEAGTRHVWVADGDGVRAYLRVLDDGDSRRIGRVVTLAAARGEGLAARLVDHAVATTTGPWALDAQSHLEQWYEARGFRVDGPEFLEDGIPHVPMRRG
jgi:ElaA protein